VSVVVRLIGKSAFALVLAAALLTLPLFIVGATRAATPGLVAAYSFNEGTGTTVGDASGSGNNGTTSNTTWSASGKYGGALSFNGTSARVNVPNSSSLQLTSSMTLEAWVDPSSTTSKWRDVIYKGNDNYYLEGTSDSTGKPGGGGTFGGANANAYGASALTANTWSYLALTYDGTTLRLYVNGTMVGSQAKTGAITTSTNQLQIGGDSLYGQYFSGLIDEVRVYNVALSATAIQTDMNTPISPSTDGTPPSAPGTLTASVVSAGEIDLSWGAATDNVGVTGYQVERCSGASCSNFAQITTVAGTTYHDTSVAASTAYTYRVRATDAAGNLGAYSNTAGGSTPASDSQPPSQPGTLSASTASSGEIDLAWGPATDNVGVTGYRIERCSGVGCASFAQIATSTGTTYKDLGVAASTSYSYRVRAADAAGNLGSYSNTATTSTPAAPLGLVAAYSFDEGSGTTVTDGSGNGNNGTVANGTWVTTGEYGKAIQFNGTNTLVSVPDATALHLTTGMTLEAWVNPSTVDSSWRDVIYKGNDNYYLEATSTDGSEPDAGLIAGGTYGDAYGTAVLPANSWSFLTETYDGANLRLYVNGVQVAATAHTGSISTSTNALQIGGDTLYGQYFKGQIDNVRIYNTALSVAQIQADQGTSVNGVLSAPGTLSANAVSPTEVDLSWGGATGGATSYLVERCAGASCSTFAQIGTSATTTLKDTSVVSNNTYSYRVRATDTGGDLGPYSNVATATTAFTVSPNNAVLTFTRTQQYTAQGPGSSGATWRVDGVAGGTASTGTITSGGLYTPPSVVGTHTISAVAGAATVSVTVYVSNDPGTFTFHNDNLRDGANLNETVLTPSNVNSTSFGKLFSYTLDGLTFASPLYVQNVNIPGQGSHNIVLVATEHDSVYAFDADGRSNTPIWKDSFINPAAGVTPIPPAVTGETGDIPNEIGITGTPVIDPSTNTVYVVAATQEVSGGTTSYVNRLHALDLTTGAEKFGGPIVIQATVPGNGDDSVNGTISFNNITENQRPALTLQNGEVYIAFSNHGNNPPYHGWVMAYSASTLHQDWVFCTTPNAGKGGVWMGGDGLGVDSAGNLYFSTGNGTFDGPTSSPGGNNDFGDSLLKLSPSGARTDFFTPYNYAALDSGDIDLASGGIILLPDQPGAHPHEVIADGKGGTVYLVDRDHMGGVGSGNDNQIVQSLINVFPTGGSYNTGNYSAPVYFNGSVYFAPVNSQLMQFTMTNGGLLSTAPTSKSPEIYNGKTSTFSARGGEIAASGNGSSNGILWGLQSNGDSTPGTLHAYDPSNLAHEYYTSDQAGTRDQLDPWLKFTIPLVANGRVYVVSSGQLTAFGLLP
jgi:Concanavalin A-like lectin/glucanases superfamily